MQTIGAIGLILIWTGALSSLWNNAGNWNPATAPPSTAVALEFPASASRKIISNNIDLSASQPLELRITGSGYDISGNGIPSCGIDATYTSGSSSISNAILAHGACASIELRAASGGTLALHNDFPATDIVAGGDGTIRYALADASARTLTIEDGVSQIESNWPATAVVLDGGALTGTGTVASITGGTGIVSPGGTPATMLLRRHHGAAGESAGDLTSGNVTFDAGTTLEIELNGALAADYDSLIVNGTVSLGGATLTPTITGFTPASGTTFTIITNDGSDALVGTFAGLAEGATLSIGAHTARVSYVGGTGNDVTLEIQAASSDPIAIMPATLGQMTVGVPFSESFTASGGIAPYTFAVTGGALPAGLSLSAAGLLSGTPTQPGEYSFTITATDSETGLTFGWAAMFASAAATYSGTVAAAVPAMPAFAITLLAVLLFVVARRALA